MQPSQGIVYHDQNRNGRQRRSDLGPERQSKAKSWTLETTTTTTTETRTDTYDTYQGNGNSQGTDQYLGEDTLDTVVNQSTETSTQKLNPGGDAPEGQQNK